MAIELFYGLESQTNNEGKSRQSASVYLVCFLAMDKYGQTPLDPLHAMKNCLLDSEPKEILPPLGCVRFLITAVRKINFNFSTVPLDQGHPSLLVVLTFTLIM